MLKKEKKKENNEFNSCWKKKKKKKKKKKVINNCKYYKFISISKKERQRFKKFYLKEKKGYGNYVVIVEHIPKNNYDWRNHAFL